jgi:hypothetical protein
LAPPPVQEPKLSISRRGRKRKSDEINDDDNAESPSRPGDGLSITSSVRSPRSTIGDHNSTGTQEVEAMLRMGEAFDKSCSIGSDDGQLDSPWTVKEAESEPIDVDEKTASQNRVSHDVPDSNMEVDELFANPWNDESGAQESTAANIALQDEGRDIDVLTTGVVESNDPISRGSSSVEHRSVDNKTDGPQEMDDLLNFSPRKAYVTSGIRQSGLSN